MMKIQPSIALISLIALVMIATMTGVSYGQLVPYDDFSTDLIDPGKWHGNETPSSRNNPNTEALRLIEDGKLRMMARAYGGTDADTGRSGGNFGLAVRRSDLVTMMQAEVTVLSATVEDCPENSLSTRARAQLFGYFFNDGSGGPGDSTGDVVAGFDKRVDSRSGNSFLAFVARCTTSGCGAADTIAFEIFDTPMLIGQADTMRLEWDAAGEQFMFTLNPASADEEVKTISYAGIVVNMGPSDFGLDRLRLRNQAANCVSGRRMSALEVLYDDVQLNIEATQ